MLAHAITPSVPPIPVRRARGPRFGGRAGVLRVGVVPVVTVGVLALAVGAGVLAGVKGSPARYSGDQAPHPSGVPSGSGYGSVRPSPPPAGPLPARIGGEAGTPLATRLARGAATWPDTNTLTLRVTGRAERVSVVVTCPSGPHLLSFTAYAVGGAGSPVSGTCVETGTNAAMTRYLRLPAGTAHVRVRVRPGTGAEGTRVAWFAGVYGTR